MKVLLLCILYVVFAYGKTIPVNEATINENSDVVPEKDTANRSKRDTYYKQHTYPSRTSDQYPGYDQSRRDGPGYERFPDPHQPERGHGYSHGHEHDHSYNYEYEHEHGHRQHQEHEHEHGYGRPMNDGNIQVTQTVRVNSERHY